MTDRANRNEWFIVLVALLLSLGLIVFSYKHPSRIGDAIPISVTVVPWDSYVLDCSSDARFDSARCNFDAEGKPQSARIRLRPYVTVRREMFILAGVFEDPSVDQWVRKARQTGNNARVTINCQATLLGILTSVDVRFRKQDLWNTVRGIPVARVSDCRVVP